MRAYWNNTNDPITYKVWTIDSKLVTANNLKTLASKDIDARIVQVDPRVIDHNGYQYQYSGISGRVEFETTCEEQELMLKLIYGKELILLTVNVVSPHSVVESVI